MAQVFSASAVLVMKLAALAALGLLATGAVVAYQHLQGPASLGEAPRQPIPFSHKHHAGDDGIDCRFCHEGVENAAFAGIPSTQVCMTCHSQLFTDAPMLAPVRASAATGTRLRWTRVHDLPDFVYFDHAVHVKNGVECVECHGRIDRMPLTRRVSSLEMQWCLDCHRTRVAANASTRRLTDCSTCHR